MQFHFPVPRQFLCRLLIGAALIAGSAALSLAPASAVAQQAKPEYPKISIPNPSPAIPGSYGPNGAEALNILKPYMPSVAAWYGLSEADISYSFLRRRDGRTDLGEWRLDNEGRIVISEKFLPYSFPQLSDRPVPPLARLYPHESTFKLHSNNAAKVRIWISLRSQETDWFPNLDVMSADNIIGLQHIWQALAEDFAPFDVDVTTEKPSDDDLLRSGPNDDRYGYQVIIDRTPSPGGSDPAYLEGLVYLNSFDDIDIQRRTITLKWPSQNSYTGPWSGPSPSPNMVAHMAAHMLGHALGLRDEDQADGLYYGTYSRTWTYRGHQTSEGTWAPIMGHPGDADITQFSQGEFRGAISQTDSFARIARILHVRADDAGDTIQTASRLPLSPGRLVEMEGSLSGIIGQQGDKDVYAVELTKTVLHAEIMPPEWTNGRVASSTNLAAEIALVDASGNVLERSFRDWTPSVAFQVPRPGVYYLVVSAIRVGNPAIDGFSNYGNLGRYTLIVMNEGIPPTADLKVSAANGISPLSVTFDASGSRDDGVIQAFNWNFGDGTSIQAGSSRLTHTYTKPGTYQAILGIRDDEGLTSVWVQTIRVWGPKELSIELDLSRLNTSNRSSAAYGILYVVDGNGKRYPNATVRYNWGGLQQGQRSLVSRIQGAPVMSLSSSMVGCFELTVTSITLAGYTYDTRTPVVRRSCRYY